MSKRDRNQNSNFWACIIVWLMGGPALAFVYIREGLLSHLQPTIAGWFGHCEQFQFKTREFEFRQDATTVEENAIIIDALAEILASRK